MKQLQENITGKMHSGIVTLVGRPNAGKSTLINSLIGLKVAVTSPKPQTTRFPIKAVLNDPRGQLLFVDTPGIFAKFQDPLAKTISHMAEQAVQESGDILLYLVDITRPRGLEENRILGLVRSIDIPKVLVFNKIDSPKAVYRYEYAFLQEEFEHVIEISARNKTNLEALVSLLFSLLPEREYVIPQDELQTPIVNLNRRMYVEELIREKVFNFLRQEIPYSITVRVNTMEDKGDLLIVDADVVTSVDRYKSMIIGSGGAMIKKIGQAARTDLESMTERKVHIDLHVVVDPHWIQEWL